jgi:hypothetical protein
VNQQPFRITPNMQPQDYVSYRIVAPSRTHFGPATCEDVDCKAMANGWSSLIDEATGLGQKQAHYIRKMSGRSFKESRTPAGLTEFLFTSGQKCFAQHTYRNELPPIFKVQGGDYRGNPRGIQPVIHTKPEFWVEDFQGHQDKVKTVLERG